MPEGLPTPGPLAHTLPDETWVELDRTLWRLERTKVVDALERNPRPYLEMRLWRIDRVLRALDVILGPEGVSLYEGEG